MTLRQGKIILNKTQKALTTKEMINKVTTLDPRTPIHKKKDSMNQTKREATEWEKIFATHND